MSNACFELYSEYFDFFAAYFDTAGFGFKHDKYDMFAIVPLGERTDHYSSNTRNLRKDETLIRIALRLIFQSKYIQGAMKETGRVETNTQEILDTISSVSSNFIVSEKKMLDELLRPLHRKGAIRILDRNNETKNTNIMILPGIQILVSDEMIAEIRNWLGENQDNDYFSATEKEVNNV